MDPSIPVDILTSNYDKNDRLYPIGNISFACSTNRTEDTTYFKYDFGDGTSEPYSHEENAAHMYMEAGTYKYSVDAVALVNEGSQAYHADHRGKIHVLGICIGYYDLYKLYTSISQLLVW